MTHHVLVSVWMRRGFLVICSSENCHCERIEEIGKFHGVEKGWEGDCCCMLQSNWCCFEWVSIQGEVQTGFTRRIWSRNDRLQHQESTCLSWINSLGFFSKFFNCRRESGFEILWLSHSRHLAYSLSTLLCSSRSRLTVTKRQRTSGRGILMLRSRNLVWENISPQLGEKGWTFVRGLECTDV